MNTGKLNIILTKNDNGVITATIPGIPQDEDLRGVVGLIEPIILSN